MNSNVVLSPRQEDIYYAMIEDDIKTPDGKKVTPEWILKNYPGTIEQPRKKKKSSSKTKRKTKKR